MPIAVDGSPGSAPAPASPGPPGVSVTDYGAVADGATDCSPAFEAAYSALIAGLKGKAGRTNVGPRGYVRWPAATRPYVLTRPMEVEDPDVWVVGDGPGSRIQASQGASAVIFGLQTAGGHEGGTLRLRDAISSLSIPHPPGAGTLTVRPGEGGLFGSPTPNDPARLAVTDPASGNVSTYAAVGRSGDTFTLQQDRSGLVLHDGDGADNAFPAGSRVENVHRPDLVDKVDAPRRKFGLRLDGDGSVFFPASPMSPGILRIRDCTLSGSNAGDSGAGPPAEASGIRFEAAGRCPIRLRVSDAVFDGVFFTDFGVTCTERVGQTDLTVSPS